MGRAVFLFLAAWFATALSPANAAEKKPYIGYVYPAGGQRGTKFEAQVGGENIYGATAAIVSGKGVTVELNTPKEVEGANDKNKKPRKKGGTVLDEIVTLKLAIARDAEPGAREICLVTPGGLSNKRVFQVGQLPEVRETEPNDKLATAFALPPLPVLVNGQVLPGDEDMFKFTARRGQHLVIEAAARALIPYIADAVPGWFQAIVYLYDAKGAEIAVADDYRFNQDPVLFFDVPADGQYVVAIRDSLYRGREDFVYRLKIGELPFITSISPLGALRGDKPFTVKLSGKNLPGNLTTVAVNQAAPSVQYISISHGGLTSNRVPFAVGDLPEVLESKTPTRQEQPQDVTLPVIVNGCISAPGEEDFYRFAGRKEQTIYLEVMARRLGSPLDSYLVLFNSRGEKIGENDDMKDKGEGLLTHLADSELICKLPEDGAYTVKIFDTQGKGGDEYAYRLRISPPMPDFELRTTPSAVSVPKGGSTPLTVYAIRKDGFTGEIALALDEPSSGLVLDGGVIPEGADKIRLTVSATAKAAAAALTPTLRGTAVIAGKTAVRMAVPAEDLMQAFIYQHLVPFKEQLVMVTKPAAPFSVSVQLRPGGYLELPLGKETSFTVTATRSPGFDGPIRLQLVDQPKGMTLRRAIIPADKNTALVTIRTESKVEGKLKDNLIITGIMPLEKPDAPGNSGPAANAAKPASEKPGTAAGSGTGAGKAPSAQPATGKPDGTGASAKADAEKGKKPAVERVIVTLPAVPFRILDNSEQKSSDVKSGPAPKRDNPAK